MAKSYFAILGLTAGASPEEIKSAYRRLAKEYHPDRDTGDSDVFRQIQEAYAVLGDQRRRDAYVRTMQPSRRPVRPRAAYPPAEPLIPESGETMSTLGSFQRLTRHFEEAFDRLWEDFSGLSPRDFGEIRTLKVEIRLTHEQARAGGHFRIMVPAWIICPACRGQGDAWPFGCAHCMGRGAILGEVPVSLSFPPGLNDVHAVEIPLDPLGIRNLRVMALLRPAPD